uniref:Uncharacterized protein n=1 Tax=Rhizochromulina marina TaxID=1034831 RepID=A0A7S2WEU3_9STRA
MNTLVLEPVPLELFWSPSTDGSGHSPSAAVAAALATKEKRASSVSAESVLKNQFLKLEQEQPGTLRRQYYQACALLVFWFALGLAITAALFERALALMFILLQGAAGIIVLVFIAFISLMEFAISSRCNRQRQQGAGNWAPDRRSCS